MSNVFRILRGPTTVIEISLFFTLSKKMEKGLSDSFVTRTTFCVILRM